MRAVTWKKDNCAKVGRLLGAPSSDNAVWIWQIMRAQKSGNGALDTAMHELAVGLRQNESAYINVATARLMTVCNSLGLWQVYH